LYISKNNASPVIKKKDYETGLANIAPDLYPCPLCGCGETAAAAAGDDWAVAVTGRPFFISPRALHDHALRAHPMEMEMSVTGKEALEQWTDQIHGEWLRRAQRLRHWLSAVQQGEGEGNDGKKKNQKQSLRNTVSNLFFECVFWIKIFI
jgi:hypothetical protein